MRVLIVDDESLIRMDLRDILECGGHEVVGEGINGVEAITLAKELKPDVILMDVKMPELDGVEAARQIRHHRLAPVVLLTAYSQEDLVKKARESGVYGYLIKPLREEQLIPSLMMAVGRYEEEQVIRDEVAILEKDLEERKLINKATAILMELYKISEDEAFRRIRKFSMNKQLSIGEVCRKITEDMKKRDRS